MVYETPATLIRRKGCPTPFAKLGVGDVFECNGNVWTKRTSKTAAGIWPAILPAWAYFKANETTYKG